LLTQKFHEARDASVKVREVIKLLEENGWYQVRMRGSHRQFQHDSKGER
jgi:predicted RNA binding protein YcfA (HicA-like mRNA interferase family)